MRNLIVLLAFMSFLMSASVVHAADHDILNMDGLDAAAQAELALQAAQLRKDALVSTLPDVIKVEKYVSVGEQIGKALSSTARELGIEVNKFATTPVGMIAIFLIVWHFFGSMIVHLMFGSMWFSVLIPTWIYFFKRLAMNREETFHKETGKLVSVKYSSGSPDVVCTFLVSGVVIFAVGVIGIFSY